MNLFSFDGQYPYPVSFFIHDNQCACRKLFAALLKCSYYDLFQMVGQHILGTHLNDAWRRGLGRRKNSSEIKIVSEDDMIVIQRPLHNLVIRCARVPDS